jgi:hypothetical protein
LWGDFDGSATKNQDYAIFQVQSLSAFTNVIITFFNRFPLITKKSADFMLFKQIIDLMNRKEHFSMEGLQKIVNLRS